MVIFKCYNILFLLLGIGYGVWCYGVGMLDLAAGLLCFCVVGLGFVIAV